MAFQNYYVTDKYSTFTSSTLFSGSMSSPYNILENKANSVQLGTKITCFVTKAEENVQSYLQINFPVKFN